MAIRWCVAFLAASAFLLHGGPPKGELPFLVAPALKPGDTVAVVSPAGPADLAVVKKYAATLEKAGYKVRLPAGHRDGYLGGTDAQRADELNAALRDPAVRAVFACRGGFGLTRILDRIDYDAHRKDPKIVCGYSDLTALHLAIYRKSRVVSFHSPMPMVSLHTEEPPHDFAAMSFKRAVFAASYAKKADGYVIDMPKGVAPTKLVGGKARGRLVGGNLSLVCATLGTPFAVEAKGNILFLEDVNEAPYRVDRMLSQLRLSGVLGEVSGVVLGSFTTKSAEDVKKTREVLRGYFDSAKVPVLADFPVGHQAHNATLPHGAEVELDANAGTLRVTANPVKVG